MDLFVESANKIYEKIIRLHNKRADKKERDELHEHLKVDLIKNKDKMDIISDLVYGKDQIPVRCSLLEKQAFKEFVKLPYADVFLDDGLIKKIETATRNVETEWRIDDIHIVNKGKIQGKLYRETVDKIKIIRRALREHKAINFRNEKEKKVLTVYPLKLVYNEKHNRYKMIYAFLLNENEVWKMFLSQSIDEMSNMEINESHRSLSKDMWEDAQDALQYDLHSCNTTLKIKGEENLRIFSHYDREVECEENDRYQVVVRYGAILEHEVLRQDIQILAENKELLEGQVDLVMQVGFKNRACKAYHNYLEQSDKQNM